MEKITTKVHVYRFDVRKPEDKAAWHALRDRLTASHPHCMESHGGGLHYRPELDDICVELETQHLFENQWNTAPIPGVSESGLRLFDWALDYQPGGYPSGIRQGYWLEQSDAMREIRRNTVKCGYCGFQEAAARGSVFCQQCVGSEYLNASELHLLRMLPTDSAFNVKRANLTEAESSYLLPLYKDAQLHGNTERDKARIAKRRASIIAKASKDTADAKDERDGMLWLMDHGIRTDNVIFYSHTGRFGFGWRSPMDAAIVSELLDVISEFPHSYDIKCADGRTLSGD